VYVSYFLLRLTSPHLNFSLLSANEKKLFTGQEEAQQEEEKETQKCPQERREQRQEQ